MVKCQAMRKETREYLSTRHSPEEILGDYSEKHNLWREKFRNQDYTHPESLLVVRGGMALGAASANGVAYKLSELGITFPGVLASSASAMTWGMIQMGFNPLETHVHMTSFNMTHLHHDNSRALFKDKAAFNIRNLARHYLRYSESANKIEMQNDSGINLGFLTTQMPERKPHIYKEGKLITGILATGAFPLAFPPIKDSKGNTLIDGDMSYKLPVSDVEDFLGFRPKEIIYARLDMTSKTADFMRKGLGILTKTPDVLPKEQWAEGIPVREILVKPDREKLKGMHSTDYHKQEQMDHIFEVATKAVEEFFK